MIHLAVGTMGLPFLRGFNQIPRFIQHSDSVVGKEDKLPEGRRARRRNNGLHFMVLLHLAERAVVFCSRRLNDDSAEQTVIFVVSQVAEGTEQAGTVFPVGMPQVFSAFPGRNSLLCIVIAHMGNDQLLPAYNVQMGVCDGYIAVYGVYQYASDSDCFQPLMEEFRRIYHKYPKYPVADVGYGNLNNYLYCEEHGMEKYMKFPMYEKETKNKK